MHRVIISVWTRQEEWREVEEKRFRNGQNAESYLKKEGFIQDCQDGTEKHFFQLTNRNRAAILTKVENF